MRIRNLIMVVAIAPLLAACPKGVGVTCPSDIQYSDAFLDEAAKEVRLVSIQAPHIVQMLGDYDITLQQIRYCIRQQKKKK